MKNKFYISELQIMYMFVSQGIKIYDVDGFDLVWKEKKLYYISHVVWMKTTV